MVEEALIQVFAVNSSTMLRLRGAVEDYLQTGDRCVGIGRFRHLICRRRWICAIGDLGFVSPWARSVRRGNWRSGLASIFEKGRRLPFELKGGCSDLSKWATDFDLVNVCGKSRCIAIGSLGFDLFDQNRCGLEKADTLLSALERWPILTIGKNKSADIWQL
jgi:hypothetical protein